MSTPGKAPAAKAAGTPVAYGHPEGVSCERLAQAVRYVNNPESAIDDTLAHKPQQSQVNAPIGWSSQAREVNPLDMTGREDYVESDPAGASA